MAIREALNRNRKLGLLLAGVVMAGAVALLVVQTRTAFSSPEPPVARYWFTADDGATFFTAPIMQIPPFEKDGVEAVRAIVVQPASGGERVAAYLEKYTPEAKAKLQAVAHDDDERLAAIQSLGPGARLVKRPGVGTWILTSDPRARAITRLADGTRVVVPE